LPSKTKASLEFTSQLCNIAIGQSNVITMRVLSPIEFLQKLKGPRKQLFEDYLDNEFEEIRAQLEDSLMLPVRKNYRHIFILRNTNTLKDDYYGVCVAYWKKDEGTDVISKQIVEAIEYESEEEQRLDFYKRQIRSGDIRISN